MITATQYRAKAAEYTELLKAARLPAETREFRKRQQSYLTLAENEEWMADNPAKMDSRGADENWYGEAILAQQGKHPIGCQEARCRNAVHCGPNAAARIRGQTNVRIP